MPTHDNSDLTEVKGKIFQDLESIFHKKWGLNFNVLVIKANVLGRVCVVTRVLAYHSQL